MIRLTPTLQGMIIVMDALLESCALLMLLLGALNSIPHILLQSISNLCGKYAQQQTSLLISGIT